MNSMAQQAVPKMKGHKEYCRPQLMIASSFVVMTELPRLASNPTAN